MNDLASEASRQVHCITDGSIGWLRIDNPKRLNAMSLSMWGQLAEGISRLTSAPEIRVIILTGTGEKAFCSGGDISEFSEHRAGADAMENYDVAGKHALALLASSTKPTIAMIRGYCMGGGLALALHCDLRIADESAQIGIPAAKLGLSYDLASMKRLVDLVGPADAKLIMYTGRNFSAAEAQRMGLVAEITAPEGLAAHIGELANTIAANAPLSISASKLLIETTLVDPGDRDLAACSMAERVCLESQDYAEATRAFMEKRVPIFIGQ